MSVPSATSAVKADDAELSEAMKSRPIEMPEYELGSTTSSSDDTSEDGSSDARTQRNPTIRWKQGYTVDENGERRELTPEEMDNIRKERNRMHAKLTRERKKVYVSTLTRVIGVLEEENKRAREILERNVNATVREPGQAPTEPQAGIAAAATAVC